MFDSKAIKLQKLIVCFAATKYFSFHHPDAHGWASASIENETDVSVG